MDVPFLLERLFHPNTSGSMGKHKLKEQKGGLHFIAFMIVKILTFVFGQILLPLVLMVFQLPSFFREKDKKDRITGKYLDEDGEPLPDQNDPTIRVKVQTLRTKFGFIPAPEYTPEMEGKGYFWKFVKYCFKISWGLVVGMLGGIYLVLGGMIYMIVKIFKDFTDKPRAIAKQFDTKKE